MGRMRAREGAAPAAARDEARQVLRARLRPLPESLVPVRASDGGGAGGLWLLPAGLRLGNAFPAYAQSVQTFDWGEFYASYHGKEYFDWMREQLTGFADVVLIDSRTGVTEMSGVCARQLADVVVSFCAPNRQNLEGVVQMSDSFAREEVLAMRGERPLELVIVPTRLDNSETTSVPHSSAPSARCLPASFPAPFSGWRATFWSWGFRTCPSTRTESSWWWGIPTRMGSWRRRTAPSALT